MAKNKLHKGDKVMTLDGRMLGTVKDMHDTCIHIKAPGRRDYWLAKDAVQASVDGVTLLSLEYGSLKDASISPQNHHGMHSHDKMGKSNGGGGGIKGALTSPMFILLSTAILAMRSRENREKVMSAVKQVQDKMHTNGKMNDKIHDDSNAMGEELSGQGLGGGTASGTATGDLSAMKPPPSAVKDEVDEASWESFPASDPPARY